MVWRPAVVVPVLALVSMAAAQQPWSAVTTIDGDPVMRGLPRDAIPAINRPVFVKGAGASHMQPDEYVIGVTDGQAAKAYSTWHLNGHEIVNDMLGDRPIAVTWCPLCFTGIVYDRRVDGRTLRFGVSGMLWRENLVMYDRETDSWWAQATGTAIRGPLKDRSLTLVVSTMTTWKDWLARHPDTLLLSKASPDGPQGRSDAYAGYHTSQSLGVTGRFRRSDSGLDDKARVLGFRLVDQSFVVPLTALAGDRVISMASPVPALVVSVGSGAGGRVFLTREHRFSASSEAPGRLVDAATESSWNRNGLAISGPLQGRQLEEVPASLAYWFAWRAFFPASQVIGRPPRVP